MTVRLRRYTLLPPADRDALLDVLRDGYDTPVAGSATFDECLTYLSTKPGLWGIYVGDALAGLFALGPMQGFDHYRTTTILAPAYRGSGVNTPLKRAVAEAMRDTRIPLAASVRLWNTRSIRAMAKAFPSVVPSEVVLPLAAGENAGAAELSLFYDLSAVPMSFVEHTYVHVYETIVLWARARFALAV